MTQTARVVATAAAFAIVVGIAIVVLRPLAGPGGVGSGASPTATVPPVPPTNLPSAPPTEVRAETFDIPFRMTWDVAIETRMKPDIIDIFFGDREAGSTGGGMNVLHVEQVGTDPCQSDDLTADPLQTAEEFMAWLETIPDTTVGPVTATTLGGQPALERTLTVGSLDGCFDTGNLHTGISSGRYFLGSFEHDRWIALEVDGQLMAVVMYPANVPTLALPAQRALETLEFLP